MSGRLALCACGLLALLALPVRADQDLPPILREVGIDQRLNEQVPLDLPFHDEHGNTVLLSECCGGKPTILVLAYYRCPMLCTQVLNGVLEAMRQMSLDAGDDFNVVTVSFDARERPVLAAAKKAMYLSRYGRPHGDRGWRFLTGEQDSITRLTQAVGFRYRYDPKQDQFAHASGIMVLTPQGKIARYFFGIDYPPRDLRLSLVEASANKIGSPIDQVVLFCYHYDATTGQYTPMVMNILRLAAALTVLLLGGFIGLSLLRERLQRRDFTTKDTKSTKKEREMRPDPASSSPSLS